MYFQGFGLRALTLDAKPSGFALGGLPLQVSLSVVDRHLWNDHHLAMLTQIVNANIFSAQAAHHVG